MSIHPMEALIREISKQLENPEDFFNAVCAWTPEIWKNTLTFEQKKLIWRLSCETQQTEKLPEILGFLAKDETEIKKLVYLDPTKGIQYAHNLIDTFSLEEHTLIGENFIDYSIPVVMVNILEQQTPWTTVLDRLLSVEHTYAPTQIRDRMVFFLNTYNWLTQRERTSGYDDLEAKSQRAKEAMAVLQKHGATLHDEVITRQKDLLSTEFTEIVHRNSLDYVLFKMKDNFTSTALDLVLDLGADWQRLWDDPQLDPQTRQILSEHPVVRKVLLEDISSSNRTNPNGVPAPKPKL